MKKLVSFLTIMFVVALFVQTVNAQNPVNFNLSMTVDKYIETMQSPVNFNFGTTSHTLLKAEELIGATGVWDLAYANCGFSVTIAGDNPASQGVPRFARAEVGTHGGAFDVLNTVYDINLTTNGVSSSLKTGLFGWGIPLGAKDFPRTKSFTEAPHNGQVKMEMKAYVNTFTGGLFGLLDNVPLRQTLINPSFSNQQSADAGDYTCTMLVTLAAL